MRKLILLLFLLAVGLATNAQNNFLILKKRNKNIEYFYKDSHIAFQLTNGVWLAGVITKITPDSFYITQEVVRRAFMLADTMRIRNVKIALKNITAMPTLNEQVSYDYNGNPYISYGHEKFVWVRNGLIFQLVGGGYAGLNIANKLIDNNPPFTSSNLPTLAVCGGLLLFGTALHHMFYPYWHIGKKYHFQYIEVTPADATKK